MEFFKRPSHSQNTLYLSGIDDRIINQQKAICKTITQSQQKSLEGHKQLTNSIIREMNTANQLTADGTLQIVASNESLEYAIENMYNGLEEKLQNIDNSIQSFHNNFNEALSLVIDQLWYANKTLDEIADELKIPEIERERRHYLHQAIKYFSQDMFKESTQRLIAAKNILQEKNIDETNPSILYFLGFCYYKQHSEIEIKTKAEKYLKDALFYFDEAAFYSTKEIERESQSLNNTSDYKDEKLYKLVYESLFFAAKISYFFGDFKKSIGYCKYALEYFPDSLDLKFYLSKYLCANNQCKKAVSLIEHIIREKPEFSIQVKLDGDLISKVGIVQLLEKLRDEYVSLANDKYSTIMNKFIEIKEKYNFSTTEIKSKHLNPISIELSKIDQKIRLNLFMDAVNALNLINLLYSNELINSFALFQKMLFELNNNISELEKEYLSFLKNEDKSIDLILKRFNKLREIIDKDYYYAKKIYDATKLQFDVEQSKKKLAIFKNEQIPDRKKLRNFEELEEKEKKRLERNKQIKENIRDFFTIINVVNAILIISFLYYIISCSVLAEIVNNPMASFVGFFGALFILIFPIAFIYILIKYFPEIFGTIYSFVCDTKWPNEILYIRPNEHSELNTIIKNRENRIIEFKRKISKLESEIKVKLNNEIIS